MYGKNLVPSHVAIIMDGNGRWAKQRGLARTQGHEEGLQAAKRIVLAARIEGIHFLSLYAFPQKTGNAPPRKWAF